MHSSERTLLNQLGFQDPDKRSSKHDEACHYVAANASRLISILDRDVQDDWKIKTNFEVLLTKGEGQYRTHIGFLDVVIEAEYAIPYDVRDERTMEWKFGGYNAAFRNYVVEVKVNKVQLGDVLRQMKLYREYRPRPGTSFNVSRDVFVLATCYAITESEFEVLRNEDIYHVLLPEDLSSGSKRTSWSPSL